MNVSTLFTILIFSAMIVLILLWLMQPLSQLGSQLVAKSVAREMNAPSFLGEQSIQSLEQLSTDTLAGKAWLDVLQKNERTRYRFPFIDKSSDPMREIYTVTFKITAQSRILYESPERVALLTEPSSLPWNQWLIQYFSTELTIPLMDAEGREVGSVIAGIYPPLMVQILWLITACIVALGSLSFLINYLLCKYLTVPMVRPLKQLRDRIRKVASEDAAVFMEKGIQLDRPYVETLEIAEEANKIVTNIRGYLETARKQTELLKAHQEELEAQKEELEAQNETLEGSQAMIRNTQELVRAKEQSVRRLLDNAGQGFLSFGSNLLIHSEYSAECRDMLQADIANQLFPELLLKEDSEIAFLRELLLKIFEEPEEFQIELYLGLLTEEMQLHNKVIHFEYKLLTEELQHEGAALMQKTMMVILTDITETRRLEQLMEEESKRLKMVVSIVGHYKDFTECLADYESFCDHEIPELLISNKPMETILSELYRELHTYKGNFAIFNLVHTVKELHQAEDQLSVWMHEDEEALTPRILAERMQALNPKAWTETDIDILSTTLGESMAERRDVLIIDKEQLIKIEDLILEELDPLQSRKLVPELRRLRHKPFTELLRMYPDYAVSLAERNDKEIKPFTIEGGDFYVDYGTYHPLARSLIHIIRNMVDHGIETPEDRAAVGKQPAGNLRCAAFIEQEHIIIELEDDGNGLDLDKVMKKALDKGIVTEAQLQHMTMEAISQLIFREELSTNDQITELSGRGIGLTAVRAETDELGGSIEVVTLPGTSTKFIIRIPYMEMKDIPNLAVPDLMQPLLQKTVSYLNEAMEEEEWVYKQDLRSDPAGKLMLLPVTAYVKLKGTLKGLFVLTADEGTANRLFQQLLIGGTQGQEIKSCDREDAMAEAVNTIVGNSLAAFEDYDPYVKIDPPVTVAALTAALTYPSAEIWTSELSSGQAHSQMGIRLVLMSENYSD
ncbi:ATP-binding protein [Paenibacillus agricola]|nr:ATP-binding protein [Paenibacillus agricola]